MAKVIEITARRDGFRRCGVAHSATTKAWPADAFTPEQLEVLKADPMLIVVERDTDQADNVQDDALAAERQKVSELMAQLEEERRKVKDLTAKLKAAQKADKQEP
ncbi:HI1506-related protein [Escherichia albertii]|uniref:HI1506-related protein n=1 Tax=Escherichia albertii TaxID=208962 RepID=UPI0011326867|nr:HI1506-related protein [Escherichia albertii]